MEETQERQWNCSSHSPMVRTRRADDVRSSRSPKTGEDQCPSSKAVRESKFSLPVLCSIQVFKGLDAHPQSGPSALLSLTIQMLISPRNTLTDTLIIMCNQISGHPMAQSSRHIKLTITAASLLNYKLPTLYLGSKSHQVKWILESVPIFKVTIITGFRPNIFHDILSFSNLKSLYYE